VVLHDLFEEVRIGGRALVKKIGDLSKKQRHLWQQVPYLALHADGRSGWRDDYNRAYTSGYWALASSQRNYTVYVDLETGNLVDAYDLRKSAKEEDILALAMRLYVLRADKILRYIRFESTQPIAHYYSADDRKKREQYIASFLEEGNITNMSFRRTIDPKEVHDAQIIVPLLENLSAD